MYLVTLLQGRRIISVSVYDKAHASLVIMRLSIINRAEGNVYAHVRAILSTVDEGRGHVTLYNPDNAYSVRVESAS